MAKGLMMMDYDLLIQTIKVMVVRIDAWWHTIAFPLSTEEWRFVVRGGNDDEASIPSIFANQSVDEKVENSLLILCKDDLRLDGIYSRIWDLSYGRGPFPQDSRRAQRMVMELLNANFTMEFREICIF